MLARSDRSKRRKELESATIESIVSTRTPADSYLSLPLQSCMERRRSLCPRLLRTAIPISASISWPDAVGNLRIGIVGSGLNVHVRAPVPDISCDPHHRAPYASSEIGLQAFPNRTLSRPVFAGQAFAHDRDRRRLCSIAMVKSAPLQHRNFEGPKIVRADGPIAGDDLSLVPERTFSLPQRWASKDPFRS